MTRMQHRAEQDILAKCVFAGKIEEELMDEYMDSDIADMDTEAERLDGAKAGERAELNEERKYI